MRTPTSACVRVPTKGPVSAKVKPDTGSLMIAPMGVTAPFQAAYWFPLGSREGGWTAPFHMKFVLAMGYTLNGGNAPSLTLPVSIGLKSPPAASVNGLTVSVSLSPRSLTV